MRRKFKILLIFINLFSLTFKSYPQAEKEYHESGMGNLESEIQEILSDPFFNQTLIALDIFDLTDSISLFNSNEKLLLTPASNMKILTSISGLIKLGNEYQFKTDLYYNGIIKDEILFGDLYVVGGFDPDFTIDDIDSLVTIVKASGIKGITGKLYGDVSKKDSLYWGKGWMWDDDPDPDQPYLSALNVNRNSIKVFVEGSEIGSPAKVTLIPETEFVNVINNTVTVPEDSSDNFRITRDWVNRTNNILVDGKVRKTTNIDSSANTRELNILYPEKYFLTLFKEHLEKEKIKVDGGIGLKKLGKNSDYVASINRDIDTVLSNVNKMSDNLCAEMVVYAVALNDSCPAIADRGLAAIRELTDSLKLIPADYFFADGSGVSHYNLVSAELLLESLKYIYYQRKDLFDTFYNSLSVAGIDGTLKNRMKDVPVLGNVHAKTGTLKGVSNLSGFVTAMNGHLIAFSILIQNFVEEYSRAREIQNKICELLAEFE